MSGVGRGFLRNSQNKSLHLIRDNFSITGDVYRTSIGKRELIPDPIGVCNLRASLPRWIWDQEL